LIERFALSADFRAVQPIRVVDAGEAQDYVKEGSSADGAAESFDL
jgi:hypothetical protein